MKYVFYLLLVVIIIIPSGCGDDDNPAEPDVEPTFSVFSQPVVLSGNTQGLQFYGRCETDDVNMISVRITNPANNWLEYNLGNALALKSQNFACQDDNTGYVRFTGTWTLTFKGNKAAGTKSSFEITVQHPITGKEAF
jgi:hypothetical protein